MFPEGCCGKYDKKGDDNDDSKKKEGGKESEKKGGVPKINPRKQPPKSVELHEKQLNGKTIHWCGTCGRWGNHKTADHKSKEELEKEKENNSDSSNQQGSFAGATALNF